MRASTGRPRALALAALISSTAAAPSFRLEALPAVTLPSFLKAGLSLPRDSAVVPARGCSSVAKATGSPLREGIRIGVISSTKRPASMAAHGFLLRGGGKGVLGFAADVVLVRQIFGGDAHVVVVEGIPQAVLEIMVSMTLPWPMRRPVRAPGMT